MIDLHTIKSGTLLCNEYDETVMFLYPCFDRFMQNFRAQDENVVDIVCSVMYRWRYIYDRKTKLRFSLPRYALSQRIRKQKISLPLFYQRKF